MNGKLEYSVHYRRKDSIFWRNLGVSPKSMEAAKEAILSNDGYVLRNYTFKVIQISPVAVVNDGE